METLSWLKSGNWLRNHDPIFMIQVRLLFTWCGTFMLIHIKLKFRKASYPFHFKEHRDKLSNTIDLYKSDISDCSFVTAVLMVTMSTLPLLLSCHLIPTALGSNDSCHICISQFSVCSYHCKNMACREKLWWNSFSTIVRFYFSQYWWLLCL
jgi:hypothetical protein